jgi:hypothetical protein
MNHLKNKLQFWMTVCLLILIAALVWYMVFTFHVPKLSHEGTLVFWESERMVKV